MERFFISIALILLYSINSFYIELILIENSFYIETYGCTSNKADSLIISDILIKSNLVQTSLDDAQFIIINTCAVKEQTEKKTKIDLF